MIHYGPGKIDHYDGTVQIKISIKKIDMSNGFHIEKKYVTHVFRLRKSNCPMDNHILLHK